MAQQSTTSGHQARAPDDSSRQRILAAAQDLFARHGFDATPTSRVAEQAEVPKGLVHYYFTRKPDLLVALIDQLPSEEIDVSALVAESDLAGSLSRLVTELDATLQSSSLLSHLLWREADTHTTVRDALQARYRRMVETIRGVIIAASPHPLTPTHVNTAADLLAHALSYRHAIARHSSAGPNDADTLSMRAKVELVVQGLLHTSPCADG